MTKTIQAIKKRVLPILKQHGIKRAAVFGSYASGLQTRNSDVDILVDIRKNISLLDFVGIKLQIEEALHKKIDLVEYDTIKPMLKEKILHEQVIIL